MMDDLQMLEDVQRWMVQGDREGYRELKLIGGLVLDDWSPWSGCLTPSPAARTQLSVPLTLSFLSRTIFVSSSLALTAEHR